jgi:2'-5' RNA ligase
VNPPKKRRIFIAIDPPEEWKTALKALQADLKGTFTHARVKWIDPLQIHITLRFLGYILSEDIPKLQAAVEQACRSTSPFDLESGELGSFPRPSAPRVLWLGILDVQNALISLEKRMVTATAAIGQKPEDRPFYPHLTIARITEMRSGDRRVLADMLEHHHQKIQTPWNVEEVLIMESQLSPQGARYQQISRHGFLSQHGKG